MAVASSSAVDRQRLGNAPSAKHGSSITPSLAKVLCQLTAGRDPVLTPSPCTTPLSRLERSCLFALILTSLSPGPRLVKEEKWLISQLVGNGH